MNDFELDLKIIDTIEKGHNNFNALYRKVGGSRAKFSEHLAGLVEDDTIKKDPKDGQYFLNDIKLHRLDEHGTKALEEIISLTIPKNIKKMSDTKLLQIFIESTINDLTNCMMLQFLSLVSPNATSHTIQTITNQRLKILHKLIKSRIDIIEKRDPDHNLLFRFYKLLEKQLEKNNIKT